MNENTTVDRELVVGIDGSTEALGALREALRLAEAFGCRVRAVSAWNWPVGQSLVPGPPSDWSPEADSLEILATTLNKVEVPAGVEVITESVYGDAADVLIEASRRAHMVLTGSTGAGMARALFLGSVSTRVAQRAACPVVVWRPSAAGLAADEALRDELALTR